MSVLRSEIKKISFLQDTSLVPVIRNYYENWSIRAFHLEHSGAKNYLSPNRRDYYKVLMITDAIGTYTLGTQTYYIEKPTIFFIPPSEIISWKSLADHFVADFCLFKKSFVNQHPMLKQAIDKYRLFADAGKHVVRLSLTDVAALKALFQKMQDTGSNDTVLAEDGMQAYLQLIMIESIKAADFPKPDLLTEDYSYIHHFFSLLEKETAGINYLSPVRIKTAKEFADDLALSPNYLNALLKKHTGQNVSAHIKSRLLDESKALLLQTDWTLQDIGYAIGFAEQPNFSAFFKKYTGLTPADFRKQNHS